ncbi:MAG: AAA-like domain-containing protein [Acidobacteriota bacterium]|nr:AAA-like domain-containing protein [Acidobacteriota bacterium]
MEKFFNTAGPCVPGEHYMVPLASRCSDLHALVHRKRYFVIHAPRQTGKTTLIQDFVRQLNQSSQYLAVYCSVERARHIRDAAEGISAIVNALNDAVRRSPHTPDIPFAETRYEEYSGALQNSLTDYCAAVDKPFVIMFDEVDSLSHDTLLSFLSQLRNGYIERGLSPFVHSLALVGMRNVRDYKVKVRPGRDTLGSSSPFNVVTESLSIRNFNRQELGDLYGQHTAATGQAFPEEVTDKIYEKTQGQPWLCNAVAREIVEKLTSNDANAKITLALADQAVENITLRRDTHIDSLLERLKEPRVRRVVEPVILGERLELDFTDDDTAYTFDLGLLSFHDGNVKPANPIYGEVIMRMLTFNSQHHLDESWKGRFIESGRIQMTALLKAFQQFWRENSDIWVEKYDYKEAAPHLILQAFLQRIVNGGGSIDREYSAGRGRIDLCITLGRHRYPMELKIDRGPKSIEKGIEQLSGYINRFDVKEGWLIIFQKNPELSWEQKIFWRQKEHQGNRIHLVGC